MKLTAEQNQRLAEKVLTPIIKIIDENLAEFDIAQLEETLEAMEDQTGTLAAWPFPETMEKAKSMKATNETFKALLELIKSRANQKKKAMKSAKGTAGSRVVKQLGY